VEECYRAGEATDDKQYGACTLHAGYLRPHGRERERERESARVGVCSSSSSKALKIAFGSSVL